MIFYFSGTGNSKRAAKIIAEKTGEEMFSLTNRVRQNDFSAVECGERAIFVTPTYAWRMPLAVEEQIEKTAFSGAKRAWFVMTCGGEIGDAARYNKALCEKSGLEYMGTYQIVMPENYIAMFGVPSKEESEKIIAAADEEVKKAGEIIASDAPFSQKPSNAYGKAMSRVVNPIFYKFFVKDKSFYATDKCISCGKCAELCPLGNIKLVDGKPKWQGNCTHCMACISYCPTEAIEYGKKSVGKRRYRAD